MRFSLSTTIKGAMLAVFASIFLFSACTKDDPQPSAQEILDQALARVDTAQLSADLAAIDDSLEVWGLTDDVQIEPNGVRYIIDSLGTGFKPNLESALQMKYSGKFLVNGEEFDANNNAVFYLAQLIIGFQTAIPQLPVGTKATLYIPSGYGYGPADYTDNAGNVLIPGGSNLIFDVHLLDAL